ncbi:MAG TPA: hypothetical protein VFM65_08450 [Flavobacteriaceae bacterium]|nr:hypothetical protein [Flavobacteriaceae bacterium]
MNETDLLQFFFNLLPALIVAVVAYYFFSLHVENENRRRRFALRKENQKKALPLRLQAYERMALFMERISPGSLLLRLKPVNDNKHDYENMLIKSIEQEFEHNIAQQIYISEECWNAIKASKNATISIIRKSNMSEKVDSPDKLREVILTDLLDKKAPSEAGLAYIKNEVGKLW